MYYIFTFLSIYTKSLRFPSVCIPWVRVSLGLWRHCLLHTSLCWRNTSFCTSLCWRNASFCWRNTSFCTSFCRCTSFGNTSFNSSFTVGICKSSVCAPPQQLPRRVCHVHAPHLHHVRLLERANEGRVPQLPGNAEVLAAPHHCV